MAQATIRFPPPGDRSGDEARGIIGESRPIVVRYTDVDDTLVDPDDTDSSGDPNASITITAPDDTDVVAAGTAMVYNSVGEFEHVFDTSTNAPMAGTYEISVEATFSGEVDIETTTRRLVE